MAQLMPVPLTVSCFSEIQIGFTSLVPADLGSPGQRAVKRVCVYYYPQMKTTTTAMKYLSVAVRRVGGTKRSRCGRPRSTEMM